MEIITKDYKSILNNIIDVAYENKVAHIGSSVSPLLIMLYLYKEKNIEKNKFILSKGHGALGYFSILNHFGYISQEELKTFCQNGSSLYGHVTFNPKKGMHATAGSLGNGVAIATGIALASPNKKVYVIIGDGECDEGIVWESARFAYEQKLSNLYFIIDNNGWKGYDKTETSSNLVNKFSAFGFNAIEENIREKVSVKEKYDLIKNSFKHLNSVSNNKPNCIIFQTDKSIFHIKDQSNQWHYQKLDNALYNLLKEKINNI